MRDLGIMLEFEDNTFDGLGKEAEDVYRWAKQATQTKGGPETVLRVKYLIQDLGLHGSKGKALLRRLAHWTSLDTRVQYLNSRKAGI
jgi:hypothetical protein